MFHHLIRSLTIVTVALTLLALPADAQPLPAELNLNAYQCPAGYDQIIGCHKISGVAVSVVQGQATIATLVTSDASGVTLPVPVGAVLNLEIAEIPAGTQLESGISLSLTVVEGQNPVTLVFVEEVAPVRSYLALDSWLCPTGFTDLTTECDRLGNIAVDVSQNQGFTGELITSDTSTVTLDLTVGAFVDLGVVAIPAGLDFGIDSINLSFTAVAGENRSTLIFVPLLGDEPSAGADSSTPAESSAASGSVSGSAAPSRDAPGTEPVSGLPSTGTGPMPGQSSDLGIYVVILALSALIGSIVVQRLRVR